RARRTHAGHDPVALLLERGSRWDDPERHGEGPPRNARSFQRAPCRASRRELRGLTETRTLGVPSGRSERPILLVVEAESEGTLGLRQLRAKVSRVTELRDQLFAQQTQNDRLGGVASHLVGRRVVPQEMAGDDLAGASVQ